MTGPIETAYVSILPDVDASKFSKEVNSKVDAALKGVGQTAAKAFGAVEDEANQAGKSIATDMDKAATGAKTALGKIGSVAEHESDLVAHAFDGAGVAIETDITKGSTGAKEELSEIPVQANEAAAKTKAAFAGTGEVIAKEAGQGRSALSSLKGALIGVGALSAAYAGFSFLKEGTLDAEEAASGMKVIDQLLKQAGDSAQLSSEKIAQFATDQSFKIGVDDDDILAASKNLISLEGISQTTFERASAAGADLAAVLGKGLAPTTKSLAKALGDPAKAAGVLAKANVFLTDTQKDNIQAMVDAGDVEKARGTILDLVEGKVKGSAAASATATSKIGTAFAELRETVGGVVTNLLNKAAPALVGFFTNLQESGPAIKDAFGKLADIFGPLFSQLGDAIANILPKLKRLAEDIAPFAVALAAIGTIIVTEVLPYVGQLIDGISSTVEFITNLVSGSSALQTILLAVGGAIGTIIVALKLWAIVTKVLAGVQLALNAVMSANPIGLIVLALAGLIAGLVIAYQRSETFRAIVDAVAGVLKGVLLGALDGVKAAIGFVIDFIQRAGDKLLFLLGPIGAIIFAFKHFDEIKQIVGNVVNAVIGFLTGLPGKAGAALSSLAGKVKEMIGNAAVAAAARASDLVTDVINFVKKIPGKIGEFGSDMVAAGKGFIGKLFDGILEGAKAAGGFVASLVDSIKSAINSALNLPLTIDFDKGPVHIHATLIPALAKGGVIDKATLALIGEAGKEVVIPLTNPGRAASLARESGLVDIPAVQRAFAANPSTASPTARAFGRQPTSEAFSAAASGKAGTGPTGSLEAAIAAQTRAIQNLPPSTVEIRQNYFGPTSSNGRMREIDWTLRYATRARNEQTGLAKI